MKFDDHRKRDGLCKLGDSKRLIDPRICSLHFEETNIAIRISGRKNIPQACYPTIFDPTKAKNTTTAHSKRVDNHKTREQPKVIRAKACETSQKTPRKNNSRPEYHV